VCDNTDITLLHHAHASSALYTRAGSDANTLYIHTQAPTSMKLYVLAAAPLARHSANRCASSLRIALLTAKRLGAESLVALWQTPDHAAHTWHAFQIVRRPGRRIPKARPSPGCSVIRSQVLDVVVGSTITITHLGANMKRICHGAVAREQHITIEYVLHAEAHAVGATTGDDSQLKRLTSPGGPARMKGA